MASNVPNATESGTQEQQQEDLIVTSENGQIKITHKAEGEELKNGIKPFDEIDRMIRITQDGKSPKEIKTINSSINIIRDEKYPASGITGAVSMDFDPITGDLWFAGNKNKTNQANVLNNPLASSDLTYIDRVNYTDKGDIGTGDYQSPEFTWDTSVGPMTIKFFDSNKLKKEYENGLFIGDANTGKLYYFDLSKNRTALQLNGSLVDKVAKGDAEIESQVFLSGLGGITDMEVGPDGYLYFSTVSKSKPEDKDAHGTHESIFRLRGFGK